MPRTTIERRYGEGFLDHVRTMIEASGFDHAPPPIAPRSAMALELAELARGQGRHDVLHQWLFRAYWSEGRNIGDLDVLLSIASDADLDTDRVRHALETGAVTEAIRLSTTTAHEIGVDAVPAWLIDQRVLVLGAQPHDAFDEILTDLGYQPVGAGAA